MKNDELFEKISLILEEEEEMKKSSELSNWSQLSISLKRRAASIESTIHNWTKIWSSCW